MKTTGALFGRHVGRMIKWNWYIQGKIRVYDSPAEKLLKGYGFDVLDVKKFLYPPKPKERYQINGLYDRELPLDKHHPDYRKIPCFMCTDNHILLEGLEQAKVLTNTVERDGLPLEVTESENNLDLPEEIHSEIKKRILLSCVFEATQQKLPIRKDPLRPAWRFPRDYGISYRRKNELLTKNLIAVCEQYYKQKNKSVVYDVFFSAPFKAHNKNIQFEMTSEVVVTTSQKLKSLADSSSTFDEFFHDLKPVHCTVGLKPTNFYEMKHIYPFSMKSKYPFIQTALVACNHSKVKNIFEEEVTEAQIQGRSLIKGFCLAAAQARALFGTDVLQLPQPVVVPVVHMDGKMFHFTLYQLNTLELDNGSQMKNIFWNSQRIPLYETCKYVSGKPVLENYNADVIRKLLTFLNIQ